MFEKISGFFQSGQAANKSRGQGEHKASKQKTNPYACVEIKMRMDHCDAVEAYAGQRLLTGEAPWLPLSDCDNAKCRCKFIRYDDRRADQRRDVDIGISRREFTGEDRRSTPRGRRTSDLTAA